MTFWDYIHRAFQQKYSSTVSLCFWFRLNCSLTLSHSERPKLYTILAFLSAIGCNRVNLLLFPRQQLHNYYNRINKNPNEILLKSIKGLPLCSGRQPHRRPSGPAVSENGRGIWLSDNRRARCYPSSCSCSSSCPYNHTKFSVFDNRFKTSLKG